MTSLVFLSAETSSCSSFHLACRDSPRQLCGTFLCKGFAATSAALWWSNRASLGCVGVNQLLLPLEQFSSSTFHWKTKMQESNKAGSDGWTVFTVGVKTAGRTKASMSLVHGEVLQQAADRLLSGCCLAVVWLLSGCCLTVVRLLSDCCLTVVRLLSDQVDEDDDFSNSVMSSGSRINPQKRTWSQDSGRRGVGAQQV